MQSKRVPDRVHVVRPPEQDIPASGGESRTIEIVRMLAQISDKLKRSEAERYELLAELREYRKSLRELEDKTENSEKAYLAIENRLKSKGSIDTEATERQSRFEKSLKETEERLVKAIAAQAVMHKRLQDQEDRQTMIHERLDASVAEQARLDRQLELTAQDKSRLLRKLESLEGMVSDTRDALNAKAMVLLTDKSQAAQAVLAAPDWSSSASSQKDGQTQEAGSALYRILNRQNIGLAAMIVAALLAGWTINQAQQPDIPQIAVLENGGIAKLNLRENRWEPVTQGGQKERTEIPLAETSEPIDSATESLAEIIPASGQEDILAVPEGQGQGDPMTDDVSAALPQDAEQDILNYSDDQLLEALEVNPEGLAEKLNALEPQSVPDAEAPVTPSSEEEPKAVNPMRSDYQAADIIENFEQTAFVQNEVITKSVLADKKTGALSDRITADETLPVAIRQIEKQAFAGNAEAQHDLAAIYTAGHAGVKQNFEKAALWFREAADNNIPNARYNLGVLYHQGLGQARDLSKALYWYREAAKLGHAEAQYNLGIAMIEGIGTDYNPRMAAAFFERAANNGITEAAYNLGLIFENGLLGTPKQDEALLWYKIAADQGSPDAKAALASMMKALQIDQKDVDALVDRMQQINEQVKGRRAGPQANKVASVSSAVAPADRALVAQIQEYLMLSGAYEGPADGKMGPKTIAAIKNFQDKNGLAKDGQASQSLLSHMMGG